MQKDVYIVLCICSYKTLFFNEHVSSRGKTALIFGVFYNVSKQAFTFSILTLELSCKISTTPLISKTFYFFMISMFCLWVS